jgi:hypothetical protein
MTRDELYQKWCCGNRGISLTPEEMEAFRRSMSGTFLARINGGPTMRAPNIVTNEGLDAVLSVHFAAGTQITTWYLAASKTNTAASAAMTYAVPVFTEIAGSDVSESTRTIWTPGAVASQSVTNNASRGQYTAATGLTIYSAALVGGGSAPSTIADTAGGGTMHSYGLFTGGSRTLVATDVIELAYQLGSADDGA